MKPLIVVRFSVALLFLAPARPALGLASQPTAAFSDFGTVTLEVIQCSQGRAEVPQLSIAPASEYPHLHYTIADRASVARLDDGYYAVMDQLPQGNYFFEIRSTGCFSYFQSAILAGHKRLLSVALARRVAGAVGGGMAKLFGSENAVAGVLAVRPSVGWIVAANGSTRVLDLQDGAYYIERVPPGRYSLRFELHGSLQSEISLDLRNFSPTQFLERDVDIATFRKNLGAILSPSGTLKKCSYCY